MLTLLQRELSQCFVGVNTIYTGLTGSSKLFFHHVSKCVFGLAFYFGLDCNSPLL